jgi:hypothetical protein
LCRPTTSSTRPSPPAPVAGVRCFVGESTTLSAEAQARLLGEAWERADTAQVHDVRLVVHHRSGRTDTYNLGAHDPELSSRDRDLIHHVWLDAVQAIGPHVHHHDVVRAALTQMAEQLKGPQREDALRAIKSPHDLATSCRNRPDTRLRQVSRHHPQPAGRPRRDDAGRLSIGSGRRLRLLPRKDAAAAFGNSRDEQGAC